MLGNPPRGKEFVASTRQHADPFVVEWGGFHPAAHTSRPRACADAVRAYSEGMQNGIQDVSKIEAPMKEDLGRA